MGTDPASTPDGRGPDDERAKTDREMGDDQEGAPSEAMTAVAIYAWVLCLVGSLVALAPASNDGRLDNPVTVLVGGLVLSLLVYQAAFLLRYPGQAAERGVIIFTAGYDRVTSGWGVRLLAGFDLAMVFFILVGSLT